MFFPGLVLFPIDNIITIFQLLFSVCMCVSFVLGIINMYELGWLDYLVLFWKGMGNFIFDEHGVCLYADKHTHTLNRIHRMRLLIIWVLDTHKLFFFIYAWNHIPPQSNAVHRLSCFSHTFVIKLMSFNNWNFCFWPDFFSV